MIHYVFLLACYVVLVSSGSISAFFNFNYNVRQSSVDNVQSEDVTEDARLTTTGLINKYGYPSEIHHVQTQDGYILEMHRIPHGIQSGSAANKKVVFLQHGLLCASSDFVIMGPKKGLAYILADLGYDVWMGNSRGNTYSRKHVTLNPDNSADFWKFSWHEMGMYDLPAEIDYILALVGQAKLFYIGHSQGTTQFYVMASERPEYNAKIRAMFSLAPIAFMNHADNIFLQILAKADNAIAFTLSFLGVNEFLPNTALMAMIGQTLCNDQAISRFMCSDILFLICGWDSKQLNETMLPVILGHTPAGASTRQLLHYGQEVNSGEFRQFDYSNIDNVDRYSSVLPPKYNLSKITCPVALHYSENDLLSSTIDVDRLYNSLANPIGKFLVPDEMFNHLDYLWAIDVRTLVYNTVFNLMTQY